MRIKIINWIFSFVFIWLLLAVFNLGIIQGNKFRKLSQRNCIRLMPQIGSRGEILDRNGQVLVTNQLTYDLMVAPGSPQQVDQLLLDIAPTLGVAPQELKAEFKQGFISPFMPVVVAKNIDRRKAIALEELKLDFPQMIIWSHPVRYYPYGRLACHLIGYLNEIDRWRLTRLADYGYKTKDIVGFGGVEERYDYYLRQDDGALSMEVDHRGRFIRVLGFRPPQDGKGIQLTLDLKIQKIVEDNLGERKGAVIIMDPDNGEIIALTSQPGFAPAVFIKRKAGALARILNSPDAPLLNRAISGAYPAGSVFKLVVAAAALETGKINLATTFNCSGSIHVGRQEFSCWMSHGIQNLTQAIAHSCNIFFYRTGLLLGGQSIHDYALKFGFSKTTSIDLPYEIGGIVPSVLWRKIYRLKNWFDGDTVNFAIGQGDLLVTPLQITRMMAVFANRGMLVTPQIIKAIDGRQVPAYAKIASRIALKNTTIDYIRSAARKVVSEVDGTANLLSGLPLSVAGKTGTAQVGRGQAHGWFAAFFPFENPRYVICVFLEHAGSGQASVLLARQIIAEMVRQGLI